MSSSKVRLKTTSSIDPNFCDGCGTMLPPIPALGDIVCLSCKKATPAEQFDGIESSYTIWFHKVCLIRYHFINFFEWNAFHFVQIDLIIMNFFISVMKTTQHIPKRKKVVQMTISRLMAQPLIDNVLNADMKKCHTRPYS